MFLLSALGRITPKHGHDTLFGHFCYYLWASIRYTGWVLVILMRRLLLTNDIFDWFIYFVVIFCSIRLFSTVNITNSNSYLIYIMKLQVFMVLWSVLKSALALGSRFVATSQFICIAGLLTGFCMVRGFGW